jgi:RNase P protein component
VIIGEILENTKAPCDLVIIGRAPINGASFIEIKTAIQSIMIRAGLLDQNDSL